MEIKPYSIVYEFCFADESIKSFRINLHPRNITILKPLYENIPEWAILNHHQCKCCRLEENEYLHCPISVNIAELVETFKGISSSDECIVRCIIPERTYLKETSIQEGLFSIFGIIMATSNCPTMELFKPMARFHLPFSTVNETMVRAVSIYLLRQYFGYKQGIIPDIDLKNLYEHYENVRMVNEGILARINLLAKKDADQNAIIILDSLAQILTLEIQESLNSIENLFTSTI